MKTKTIKEMIARAKNSSPDEMRHLSKLFWLMYEQGIIDIKQEIKMDHYTDSLWYFTMFRKYKNIFYYKKFISEYRKYYAIAREDS